MGVFIMKRARIDPNHHKGIIVTEDLTGDPLDITGADLTNSNPMHVAIVNATGDQITSFGGGTQYTIQTPSTGDDIVTMSGVVRNDSLGSLAPTNGDRTLLQVDDNGLLKATILNADIDIRDLAFATDKVDVSGSSISAPDVVTAIENISIPAPEGGATEALQQTQNDILDQIESAVQAVASAKGIAADLRVTVLGGAVTVTGTLTTVTTVSTVSNVANITSIGGLSTVPFLHNVQNQTAVQSFTNNITR